MTVKLVFEKNEVLPGSEVKVQVQAAPGSICTLHTLNPNRPRDLGPQAATLFQQVSGYPAAVEDPSPCPGAGGSLRDFSAKWNAYRFFKQIGFKVFTNTKMKSPADCRNKDGPKISNPMPVIPVPGAGLQGNTLAYWGAENWLWSLVSTGKTGMADMTFMAPRAEAEWKALAFCSSDLGTGLSPPVHLNSRGSPVLAGPTHTPVALGPHSEPFSVELTVPRTAAMGEEFPLQVKVTNNIRACLLIQTAMAKTDGIEFPSGNSKFITCLCGTENFSWKVRPSRSGQVVLNVTAEALDNRNLCHVDTVVPKTGKMVMVTKTVSVETPEGFPRGPRTTLSSLPGMKQFSLHLDVPLFVTQGSTFGAKATVSSPHQWQACLVVKISMEDTKEFDFPEGNFKYTTCLCPGESKSFFWDVRATGLGPAPCTASAEVLQNKDICQAETVDPETEMKESITKTVLIKPATRSVALGEALGAVLGAALAPQSSQTDSPKPFSIYLDVPDSASPGELFPLEARVSNNLKECIVLQVSIAEAEGLEFPDGNAKHIGCLCSGQNRSYVWEAKTSKLGQTMVGAYAEVLDRQKICFVKTVVPEQGRMDQISKPMLIRVPGSPEVHLPASPHPAVANQGPYSMQLDMPSSVIRGEPFTLKAKVTDHLDDCIVVESSIEEVDGVVFDYGNYRYTSCLCPDSPKNFFWDVKVVKLGQVVFTATTKAVNEKNICVDNVVAPASGQKEMTTRVLFVSDA
ncbi:alpha-2-macroglobulin-like protein 1 [Ornithorhynchus anatinus]|uniref:alpha-2-macroglobulin-like protein 1 n=1 Tax=Ornithorhynchus anatinus TaxID=9258 RepID=UPI0019D456B0|nr:alpha-2-macroglobulin-like protein 1 [Ornithorhynchus anatinus]